MTRRRSCQTRSWAVAAAVAAPTTSCQASRKGSSAASRGAARGFALRRGAVRCGPQENLPEVRAQRIDVDPGRFPPGSRRDRASSPPGTGAIEAARTNVSTNTGRQPCCCSQSSASRRTAIDSTLDPAGPRPGNSETACCPPPAPDAPSTRPPASRPTRPGRAARPPPAKLQATQLAPVPVLHEIAQPRTERVAETGIVPAVDKLVPLRDLVLVQHEAKLQWQKLPQGSAIAGCFSVRWLFSIGLRGPRA